MGIRPVSKELEKIAISDLNENVKTVEKDLEHIREWLKKQPHLNIRSDDQSLVMFLRGCKWSLQRTKEKIDYFYTIRTFMPDAFLNRDPLDPLMNKMIELGIITSLPNTEEINGSRIIFADLSVVDYETLELNDLFKLFFTVLDVLMKEDDHILICGKTLLVNYENIPYNFILQFTPSILKKFVMLWQNAYPLRIKTFIGLNAPAAIEKLFNLFLKPLLSSKLQNRFNLFSAENSTKALNKFPKSFFPEKLGGTNGTSKELIELTKNMINRNRNWLLEDYKFFNNEDLRAGTPKTFNEEFNLEGSFRKLDLD